MIDVALTVIGWLGTILYLLAHVYISALKKQDDTNYYSANLIAAIFLVIFSVSTQSYYAVFVNAFWFVASAARLLRKQLITFLVPYRFFEVLFLGIVLFGLATKNYLLVSWAAALVFVIAYCLLTSEKVPLYRYHIYNAFAAVTMTPQLAIDHNFPVLILEVLWFLLSSHAILLSLKK